MFAVLISVTYALIFNSVQANTISLSIETTTGLKPAYTGLILAVLTGLVIFGGMTRIAKVASFMVPFMAGAYLLLAFVVTCMNITEVPRVLLMIVTKAFSFDSITGAAIGLALMTGIKRGLFSNEAGMGAVPNAAAAAMPRILLSKALFRRWAFISTRCLSAQPLQCWFCSLRNG